MIIEFQLPREDEKTQALVSDYFVEDYGDNWFGIKRTDFENQVHAIPEGNIAEWLELVESFQSHQNYHSTRLALTFSSDFVILYSPRNAGNMRGDSSRDYLAMKADIFLKLAKEITDTLK